MKKKQQEQKKKKKKKKNVFRSMCEDLQQHVASRRKDKQTENRKKTRIISKTQNPECGCADSAAAERIDLRLSKSVLDSIIEPGLRL